MTNRAAMIAVMALVVSSVSTTVSLGQERVRVERKHNDREATPRRLTATGTIRRTESTQRRNVATRERASVTRRAATSRTPVRRDVTRERTNVVRREQRPATGVIRQPVRKDGRRVVRVTPDGRRSQARRVIRDPRGVERVIRYRPKLPYGRRVTHLPAHRRVVVYHGRRYYRCEDQFYLSINVGSSFQFVVARPPLGVRIEYLPAHYEQRYIGGSPYFYYDDVYYQPDFAASGLHYTVVECPIGGTLVRLPEHHQIVTVDGITFYKVGPAYYQAHMHHGLVVYRRVPPPIW